MAICPMVREKADVQLEQLRQEINCTGIHDLLSIKPTRLSGIGAHHGND